MGAAEPADVTLDAALLMCALNPGMAVERIEPVVRAKQLPTLVLGPLPPGAVNDLYYGVGEVVIANVPGGNAADVFERIDVPLEERFLRLRRIDPVDRFPRVREAEREHVALGLYPSQHHPDLTEVDLRLRARRVLLRDEYLRQPARLHVDLRAAAADVVTDRRIR